MYSTVQYDESTWRSGLRSEPRWGAYSALQSPDPRKTHKFTQQAWRAKML